MQITFDTKLLIVGDVMLDRYIEGSVNRISPEAPVPVLTRRSERQVPGGAANVAANVVALGGGAILFGVVGTDSEGDQLDAILKDVGVDVRFVRDSSRPTALKTRVVAGKQQLLRIDHEDARDLTGELADNLIADVVAAMSEASAVVIADYAKGLLSDSVLAAVIGAAKSRSLPVLVDPKRRSFEHYRGASYIKPNRQELSLATGLDCDSDESARRAALMAKKETGASILLTRSERGMLLVSGENKAIVLPTEAKDVADVSGAGDTVIATFSLGIASQFPVEQAMRFANVAASLVVSKLGTATVSRQELLAALNSQDQESRARQAVDWASALEQRQRWRKDGLRVGFTNGCFDLIHPGHIAILQGSADLCDRLIVALNSDRSVSALKGPLRPIQSQAARAEIMAAIGCVDLVVIFDEETPGDLIRLLLPDVLIKGADYTEDQIVGAKEVVAAGGAVARIALREGQSTTNLIAGKAVSNS